MTMWTVPSTASSMESHEEAEGWLILPPDQYARWLGQEPYPRDLLRPFPRS
jgi:hypothetical protein